MKASLGPELAKLAALASIQQTEDRIHENAIAISRIANDQDNIYRFGAYTFALFTLAVTLAGAFAHTQLKTWAQNDLLQNTKHEFQSEIDRRFDEDTRRFDQRIESGFTQLSAQISILIMLVQRTERGEHNEAMEALGWDGKLDSLQEYPIEIQKLVVQSVLKASDSPEGAQAVAWQAAAAIVVQNITEVNLSFLYERAVSTRSWTRGYAYFRQYGSDVSIKLNPRGFFCLLEILRRNLDWDAALLGESAYEGRMTANISHYLGHLKNNMGRFEEADKLLRPKVEELINSPARSRPGDWFKITYSFLLNCSERGKPEKGLEAARFSAKKIGDSSLQLGVLRLAEHLAALKMDSEAVELIQNVRQNLISIDEDAVTLQIQARLMEREGKSEEAVQFLKEGEVGVRSGKIPVYDRDRAIYFLSCLIGELLIRSGHLEEARKELHGLSLNDNVGEARFLIALSYATEGRHEEAARHLDGAGKIHRRWCGIAQLEELYPELAASHRHLGREPCTALRDDFSA